MNLQREVEEDWLVQHNTEVIWLQLTVLAGITISWSELFSSEEDKPQKEQWTLTVAGTFRLHVWENFLEKMVSAAQEWWEIVQLD